MNTKKPLGVYFHWGFCLSKCPYCDFASRSLEKEDSLDFSLWLTEYKKAFDFYLPFIKEHQISSIFFGGGTPSLLPASFINSLLEHISQTSEIAKDVEISLEGNPSSCSKAKMQDLRTAGINRFSLGVQSFDDNVLHFLGRIHDGKTAKETLKNALEIFENVSFDMIYAYPKHTTKAWKKELLEAISFTPHHLSLYQLTIEKDSAFHRQKMKPIDEDSALSLFSLTQELTALHNLPAYEVSNHAKEGFKCRHNLAYWRYNDYLGIGPSAHGRINGIATEQYKNPFLWLNKKNKHNVFTKLTEEEQKTEKILMGLRLYEGIDAFLIEEEKSVPLIKEGFLEVKENRLCPTAKGILILNALIEELCN